MQPNNAPGRRGSHASARRAILWYNAAIARRNRRKADRRTPPPDRTRTSRCRAHVFSARDRDVECVCVFLCRGCNHWTHWDDGGSEDGAAGFCCSACANAIERSDFTDTSPAGRVNNGRE